LRNTELIVLPIGAFVVLAVCALLFNYNPSLSSARFFFAPESDAYADDGW
jgi:hypothetical protein